MTRSVDVIVHDSKGRRSTYSSSAQTLGNAIGEAGRYVQHINDEENIDVTNVTIVIGTRQQEQP